MEFLPSLLSRLDPTTTSGFIITLMLFAGVALSAWPKIRIKMVEARERIEESESAQHSRRIASMQSELDYFREGFEELRAETRALHGYAQYTARFMRKVDMFLAAKDLEMPPPPFEDFDLWMKKNEEK